MRKWVFFLFISLVLVFLSVSVVSANEINATDVTELENGTDVESVSMDEVTISNTSDDNSDDIFEKTDPIITVKSTSIKSKDTLKIYLKNSSSSPLASKKLSVSINNKKYSVFTDSNGMASLNVYLPAKTYKMTVSCEGDEQYNAISKDFTIKVSKLATKLTPYANFLLRGKILYIDLSAGNNLLASKKISIKVNGKTYSRTTNKNGRAAIKMGFAPSTYSVLLKYGGNDYYKASQKKCYLRIMKYTSLDIANTKLLTNGYLRIYLKDSSLSRIYHKTFIIKIGDKKFTKKTNAEGMVVIKPKVGTGEYKVIVKYGKYWTSKKVKGIEGNVRDPLNESIPLKNGMPDVDLMPGNYVMGDGNAKYTLTKAQYREVLKRDSYCLFLYNKLSKFTFFKTKYHPNTNHIIKREKWNVIERAINTKLVRANKQNYWPSTITVSLKGKSYTYSEVRDPQNTEYTCGPTSASVCTQVLRNYHSEIYLAVKGGSKPVIGTPCYGMIKALGKDFNCTYFYKSSFSKALKELQKGGCGLIFHTKNHYVAILDISKDGKKVLVSNSYGSYYNIPTKWLTVKYMKTRYMKNYDDGLIVRLNYELSQLAKDEVSAFYNSMGTNWSRHNTHQSIGWI